MQPTDNIRIKDVRPLASPSLLLDEIPQSEYASSVVNKARQEASDILQGKDHRKLVIVGPCSIHDPTAAIEYAKKLKEVMQEFSNELCIIMRVYFEKPRTTIGWKGLINDPNLDGSFDINRGLRIARQLLLDINELDVPTGSEFLDATIPQYISDLTSWAAIGARTTESQIHRELASGLSMPVGFKNGTTGNVDIAIDAICAAKNPHHFLGVSKQGIAAIINAIGNPDCHVILRGSNTGPNYDSDTIQAAIKKLKDRKLQPRLMVDCSHGNSNKDHTRQQIVLKDLCEQMLSDKDAIFGLMLESNLVSGKQTLTPEKTLTYGQSITDACMGWDETIKALTTLSNAVKQTVGE
jgi:3-deoxy-7-phosphoheptulonate synthase